MNIGWEHCTGSCMPLKPNKKTCHNLLGGTVKSLNPGVIFDHVFCLSRWERYWERQFYVVVTDHLTTSMEVTIRVKSLFHVNWLVSLHLPISFQFQDQLIHRPDLEHLTHHSLLDSDADFCWGYQIVSHYLEWQSFLILLSCKLQWGGKGGVRQSDYNEMKAQKGRKLNCKLITQGCTSS